MTSIEQALLIGFGVGLVMPVTLVGGIVLVVWIYLRCTKQDRPEPEICAL